MLSDTKLFVLGANGSPPYYLHFYKISFGGSTTDWATKMACISGTCSLSDSESILSADGTLIYSYFIYQNTYYLYFATFDALTGGLVGNKFKSNSNCNNVYGGILISTYVLATVDCTAKTLVIYNTINSSFIIKTFSGTQIYSLTEEKSSGRLVLCAAKSPGGYYTKFMVESISAHPDFGTSGINMNAQTTGGADDIVSDIAASLSSLSTESLTSNTYPTTIQAYSSSNSYTSDVYFQTLDQSFSVVENNSVTKKPDLPCSSGGSTTITYSLNAYGSYPLPSWVSINLNTGILTITAPNVGVNTDFYFYITSSFSSATILKVIKLTVTDCTATNCQQCSSTSSSSCSICSSGYVLSSGVCVLPSPSTSSTPSNFTSDTPKAYTVTTQSVIGCTTTVIVISSLLNSSTMANLWSMIHQVQMFFLLLITKAYIPYEVEKRNQRNTNCLKSICHFQNCKD